jgi:hypothetical protein
MPVEKACSEILAQRSCAVGANYDLVEIDFGGLLDGIGNGASDGFGRNAPIFARLPDNLREASEIPI